MLTSGTIIDECRTVLTGNWTEGVRNGDGVPFGYTSPNPGHYPWQWYWDSCFAAISWRRFDRDRAETELRSLLHAAQDDGFIGHTIFWNTPLRGPRRFTYNVIGAKPVMTASIQPPLLAWAWSIAVGDPSAEPGIVRHHAWLDQHRALTGDGLIWIVQPDESGLDASPQFDPVWRWRAHSQPGFLALVQRNRRAGYDAREVRARGWPIVCEVATNVLYSLSRSAMGQSSLTQALIDRCYDERSGLFQSDAYPAATSGSDRRDDRLGDRERPGVVRGLPVTWASLSPLALPDLPEEIGHRMVRDHLLSSEEFWLPAGPPSVAANAPGFQRDDRGPLHLPRYWRGPMWINEAWMLWLGLCRLGYSSEADELARRVSDTVIGAGLREYYDPVDGSGQGQRSFSWSTLVMEMIDADPRALNSYLPAVLPRAGV